MQRILIPDQLADEGLAVLERAGGFALDLRGGLKGESLKAALAEADGCILRSGTTLTGELLAGQARLKAIVRAGVGVDNIDVPAATRAGIVVMNTPGGNTLSTAEHTMALLLALCRHVPAADASLRGGKWDRKAFVGKQLAGKTIGIIGLGRIGLAVAKRAAAFQMRIVGYDPFLTPERAAELGIETVAELDDLFGRVDVLTVHVPGGDETRGLVGAERLAKLPKGALVLNCARGGIIDEAALLAALQSGHLAGAALDVYANEPVVDSPLFRMPNVVVTPHLGASTAEAQVNVSIEAAQLLVDFLRTGNVRFAVNMVSMEPSELAEARRHLDIAYRLGLLQAQLVKGQLRRAIVEFRGEAAKQKPTLLTAGFTMGLLEQALEQDVNLVNASILAEERGIHIVAQTSSEASDFATLIRTEVVTDRETSIASGTTRGAIYNRLVRIGPYRLDAFLEGTLMIFHHNDQPGIIGMVGTILGKHNVNIAQMTVGRNQQGGDAVGVLAVDSIPSEAAVEEMLADGRVTNLRVVKLPGFGEAPRCFG